MKRLFMIASLFMMILLSTLVSQPVFACAQVIGSGATSSTASASTSDVPKGAKVIIKLTTACVGASGSVSIKADGDKVFSSGFNLASFAETTQSYTLKGHADSLTVSLESNDDVAYKIIVSYEGSGSAHDGPEPPDNRINWRMGDDIAAIYRDADDAGNPALSIYEINADAEGELRFKVTMADLQPYLDNPPAHNTEIMSAGKVTLYALSSGEFQISLGPNAEGKIYDLIFTTLPVEEFEMFQWSVFDVLGG